MQPNTTRCICDAGPASQATKQHRSLLFGRRAFSGREAGRGKGWGIYPAPSFLLFPPGPEPSGLPLTFRLPYAAPRWPLLKPDASGWLFIQDWKQRSNSADQRVGRWPRGGKRRRSQKGWETQSVVQNNTLSSAFQRDPQTGPPTGHMELERKKHQHCVLQKQLGPSQSHTGLCWLLLPVKERERPSAIQSVRAQHCSLALVKGL